MSAIPQPVLDPASDTGRWAGVVRTYQPADVERLRPSLRIAHTLAETGARKLWQLLNSEEFVACARGHDRWTGRAAGPRRPQGDLPERVAGGRRREHGRQTYPDQSLYPCNSVPQVVRRINWRCIRPTTIDSA